MNNLGSCACLRTCSKIGVHTRITVIQLILPHLNYMTTAIVFLLLLVLSWAVRSLPLCSIGPRRFISLVHVMPLVHDLETKLCEKKKLMEALRGIVGLCGDAQAVLEATTCSVYHKNIQCRCCDYAGDHHNSRVMEMELNCARHSAQLFVETRGHSNQMIMCPGCHNKTAKEVRPKIPRSIDLQGFKMESTCVFSPFYSPVVKR